MPSGTVTCTHAEELAGGQGCWLACRREVAESTHMRIRGLSLTRMCVVCRLGGVPGNLLQAVSIKAGAPRETHVLGATLYLN
jgi:hypothetical protein